MYCLRVITNWFQLTQTTKYRQKYHVNKKIKDARTWMLNVDDSSLYQRMMTTPSYQYSSAAASILHVISSMSLTAKNYTFGTANPYKKKTHISHSKMLFITHSQSLTGNLTENRQRGLVNLATTSLLSSKSSQYFTFMPQMKLSSVLNLESGFSQTSQAVTKLETYNAVKFCQAFHQTHSVRAKKELFYELGSMGGNQIHNKTALEARFLYLI